MRNTLTISLTTLLIASTSIAQDVYISGFDNDATSSNIAQIWEDDGTKHNLTNGTNSASANDVFVYNGDVYAAGIESTGTKARAKYWKNGTAHTLTNGNEHAFGNAIFVYDDDVYVGGKEHNGNNFVAKIWKNGSEQILSDGSKNVEIEDLYVYNGDVYAVGIEYDYSVDGINVNSVIKLWKNGTPENITNGVNSVNAYSIFVDNNDVYIGGNEYNGTQYVAKVWKNGNAQNLTTGANNAGVNSVFVANGDLYAGGYDGTQPRLWINGIEETVYYNTNLVGGSIYSVYVHGNDVHLAGRLREDNNSDICYYGTYWKNQQVELTSAAPACVKNTLMRSVFVTNDDLSTKKENEIEKNFSVYPNPGQNQLNIDVKVPTLLQIYSPQGQLIKEMDVKQNTQVDIGDLTPGVYFIKDMNTSQTQKLVKE